MRPLYRIRIKTNPIPNPSPNTGKGFKGQIASLPMLGEGLGVGSNGHRSPEFGITRLG